jgi:hypothetical protein
LNEDDHSAFWEVASLQFVGTMNSTVISLKLTHFNSNQSLLNFYDKNAAIECSLALYQQRDQKCQLINNWEQFLYNTLRSTTCNFSYGRFFSDSLAQKVSKIAVCRNVEISWRTTAKLGDNPSICG